MSEPLPTKPDPALVKYVEIGGGPPPALLVLTLVLLAVLAVVRVLAG